MGLHDDRSGDVPTARVGDEVVVLDNDPLSPASVYALGRVGRDDRVRSFVPDWAEDTEGGRGAGGE